MLPLTYRYVHPGCCAFSRKGLELPAAELISDRGPTTPVRVLPACVSKPAILCQRCVASVALKLKAWVTD